MKGRIYWGVAILIILLIGAFVFMLMRNTDTEPEKVYKDVVEPSKEVMDDLRQSQMKPAEETVGHYHADGTWHEGTHAEHAPVPQNQTVSSEAPASEPIWTREKLARQLEWELQHLPEQIEIWKDLVKSLEETIAMVSESYHNPAGGRPDPIIKQSYEQAIKHLPYRRGQLSRKQERLARLSKPDGLEYLISKMGLEEELSMEANNEK